MDPIAGDEHDAAGRISAVLRRGPDLLVVLAADGTVRYGSASSERLLGYAEGTQEGSDAFSFVHPDDLATVRARFVETLARPGLSEPLEFRARHADGTWRWVESISNNCLDDPEVEGVVLSVRDVTERRTLRAGLARLSRLYEVLASMGESLAGADTPAALFTAACDVVVRAGNMRMAWIGLIEGRRVVPVARAGLDDGYVDEVAATLSSVDPRGRGPTGRAARRGSPVVCNVIREDPAFRPWRARAVALGFESSAAVPLVLEGDVGAVLSVYCGEAGFFSTEEVGLLERLGTTIALAWSALLRRAALQRAERARAEAAARFRAGFEGSAVAMAICDLDNRFLELNAAMCELLGRSEPEILGHTTIEFTHPDDRAVSRSLTDAALRGEGRRQRLEKRYVRPDGSAVWAAVNRALVDVDGARYFYLQAEDVTARRTAEDHLRRRLAQQAALAAFGRAAADARDVDEVFAAAVMTAVDGLAATAGMVVVVDRADVARVRAVAGLPGQSRRTVTPEEWAASGLDEVTATRRAAVLSEASRRSRLLVEGLGRPAAAGAAAPILDGEPRGAVVVLSSWPHAYTDDDLQFLDVLTSTCTAEMDRRHALDAVRRHAMYDELTGLPNRALFVDRLEQALTRSRVSHRDLAVLLADLDHFKLVNEAFGHTAGDDVLREVGDRLAGALGSLTVARLAGDEFVMLCEDCATLTDAKGVADRVAAAFTEPFMIAGVEHVFVSASVGIALGRADVVRAADMLSHADAAMYAAKAAGRARYHVYDERLRQTAVRSITTDAALRQALAEHQFRLLFQPQVDIVTREILGAEALIRWQHPVRGLVGPTEFVDRAEESGLIVPIGRWVMESACAAAAEWPARGGRRVKVAVNVSARQFAEAELVGDVRRALEASGLPPDRLVVEVTETVLMERPDDAIATLRLLRDLGVAVHVDDFGTGYSSLAYLNRLPLDALKIDRMFVADLETGGPGEAIAAAVLALAGALRLEAVAEGVETEAQAAALVRLGCRHAQGYLFGRPVDDETLRRLLA